MATAGERYAALRMSAERGVRSRIGEILAAAARAIATRSSAIRLVSSASLYRQMVEALARPVLDEANREIEAAITEYSKASIAALSDKDTGATGRLLNSELFGKTFRYRNRLYAGYLAADIANLLLACSKLGMSRRQTEQALISHLQDPYSSQIVARARRKGADIPTPSYGRGIYRSAWQNIVRNARGTVAVAWGREQRNWARRNGAVGFRVSRGSSFPCPLCDEEVADSPHKMTDPVPPYHVNCCCIVEYIFNTKENEEQE